MGLLNDAKQIGSGLASAATGAGRAVKDVGSAVVGAERSAVSTVASGIARVASDVASTAHKVSTYARGSDNMSGDKLQTVNHQGVSHAPNAGPAMQGHVAARPASWAGLPNESNSHDSDARSHADVPGISKAKAQK